MYAMYGGKGYVVQYLPSTSIALNRDTLQERAQGFYPPIVQKMFMTFNPIRSVQ
jgi:hypothetical protein